MGFLRTFDYYTVIQPTIFARLLSTATNAGLNANLVQQDAEEDAQEEVAQLLRPRFDLTTAFNPVLIWSPTDTYNAGQLVELNYPAWTAIGYAVNALVSYTDGNAYLCNATAISTDIPGASGKWTKIGQQNALYYIPYPYPLFELQSGQYEIGSKVFWLNNNYSAQISTQYPDQITRLNAVKIGNVPFPNAFPDKSVVTWGTGTPYSVTGLIPLAAPAAWAAGSYAINVFVTYNNQIWQSLINANTTVPGADIISWQPVSWKLGDNRDRSLVKYMVDISLYHLHAAISPQNIPALRAQRYKRACDWIDMARVGDVTPNIPLLQPLQGGPILFGGNTKRNNTW